MYSGKVIIVSRIALSRYNPFHQLTKLGGCSALFVTNGSLGGEAEPLFLSSSFEAITIRTVVVYSMYRRLNSSCTLVNLTTRGSGFH